MRDRITRRQFVVGLGGATVCAGLYAWGVEPTWVEWVYRPMPIERLPVAWHGKTLVQLSDLHVGRDVADDYIRRVFRQVTALSPDLIVITGDFVSYAGPPTLARLRGLVADLPRGRRGTMAIMGNHDYGAHWHEPQVAAEIEALLTSAGCTVLRNQLTAVDGLKIVGLDDLWAGRFRPEAVLGQLTPGEPTMVLSHNPDTCDLPGWCGYRGWILSGHTHGGQCKPPFLPPPILPVKNLRYTAGEFSLADGRRLYINRGVGNLSGIRFNARPEVTVFELGRA